MKNLKSISLVSFFTLLSRILGLIRDMILASTFGASLVLDAFVLAFTVPNLFRRLFGEGALSAAFIPIFSQSYTKEGREPATQIASRVATLMIVLLGSLVVVGATICLLLRYWLELPIKTSLALELTALLLPYLVFICVAALLSAILHSLNHFLAPALVPIVLNLFWLLGIVVAQQLSQSPRQWIVIMCLFLLLGGIFQILVQLPALRAEQIQLSLTSSLNIEDPRIKRLATAIAASALGIAAIQINVLLDRLIAWFFIAQEGALTVLYMANRLMQFPLALIGISIATVIFPIFTRQVVNEDHEGLRQTLLENLHFTFFFSFPCSLGLFLLAEPITTLIYQHNNFSSQDTLRTLTVLMVYGSGIWIFSLLQVVSKVFYSLEDPQTPVRIASFCVIINVILNLILVQFLAESGLALATVLSSLGNLTWLLLLLKHRISFSLANTPVFIGKALICGIIMSVAVYGTSQFFSELVTVSQRLLAVFCPIAVGVVSYLGTGVVLKMAEVRFLLRFK